MATPRTSKTALFKVLDQTHQPVFVLDAKRNIIFVNQACCQWTGLGQDELTSLTCKYHSKVDVDRMELIASAFCPPEAVFSGKPVAGSIAIDPDSDTHKSVRFEPLMGSHGSLEAVLALVSDEARDEVGNASVGADSSVELLHRALQASRIRRYGQASIAKWVGNGTYSKRLQLKIESAIRANTNTLIVGPPGSGKEHLANLIHESSELGSSGKILSVDCRVADPELIQDTIRYLGRFAAPGANRMLLLRINHLSAAAQSELLGFLEIPAFQLMVISTLDISGDINSLSPELLDHLEGIRIELPALSSRVEDIPFFAQLFLEEENAKSEHQRFGFSKDAMDALILHQWPGNLNELIQVVRCAYADASTNRINKEDLPRTIHVALDANAVARREPLKINLDEELFQLEKNLIQTALQSAKGNKAEAARLLGINRARLLRRIEFFENPVSSTDD